MSLYVNHKKHHDIYKNETVPEDQNQEYFMYRPAAEMIKEQKKINDQLGQNLNRLQIEYRQQEAREIAILSQLKQLHTDQLEKGAMATDELKQQMNRQLEVQKQIQQQLAEQEEQKIQVIERLDKQEAMTEKVIRQLDYLRSILFERTNHLTEKMEEGFRMASAYMHYILTSREQLPLNFMVFQKQEKEKQTKKIK